MKRTIRLRCLLSSSALALFVARCGGATRQKPGAADSGKIIEKAEKRYLATTTKDSRANWVRSNLTHGNESYLRSFLIDMVRRFTGEAGDGVGADWVARFYSLLFHKSV